MPAALTVGAWCVGMAYLAFEATTLLRADALIRAADALSVRDQWPAIEPRLNRAVAIAPTAASLGKAGVRYAERFAISGADADARRSAAFLDAAQLENPFSVVTLVHRLRLEGLRLDKRLQADAALTESLVARLRAMDPNNATVHETIARLRLSQGRLSEAADALSAARALRPSQGSLRVLGGDIARQRNDRVGAVAAYRAAVEQFHPGEPDWVLAYQRMLVTMIEAQMPAVEAARRLTELEPTDSMSQTLLGFAYCTCARRSRRSPHSVRRCDWIPAMPVLAMASKRQRPFNAIDLRLPRRSSVRHPNARYRRRGHFAFQPFGRVHCLYNVCL